MARFFYQWFNSYEEQRDFRMNWRMVCLCITVCGTQLSCIHPVSDINNFNHWFCMT